MLANGATLGYKAGTGNSYTNIPGLKELPDLGIEPELIENTALSDGNKQYEVGIGDPGNMEFKFKYANSNASDSYRVAKGLVGTKKSYQVKLHDNTTFTFDGTAAVRVSGGGVNDPVEFTMTIAVQSDITIADPA